MHAPQISPSEMATTATEAAKAADQQPAAAQANGNGEQKTRHSEVGHKSLLKSDELYQVTHDMSFPRPSELPRDPDLLCLPFFLLGLTDLY